MELLLTLGEQVQPAQTAVLVVDMQNDFCSPDGYLATARNYDVSYADGVADAIGTLVNATRARGATIVWVRSHYDFKYLAPPHIVKRREEGCCLEGSWGADFYRLSPAPGDVMADKHRFSAFSGTDLDARLKAMGITTLIVTGVATNVCVDSTLRDGFFAGFYIVVPSDCVGSNSRAGHEGTLATVRNNIGIVASSDEIIAALQASPA